MKIRDIENFFRELDKRIDFSLTVILTGGASAVCYGAPRATQDIDFETSLQVSGRRKQECQEKLTEALDEVGRLTGITPQYSEDIDRWSSIYLPAKSSRLFQKIGKVEVRLLDPELWAVGKLSRYLGSDVKDLVAVFKKLRPDIMKFAKVWGQALGGSPSSSAQVSFKRQVEQFFMDYQDHVDKKAPPPEELMRIFMDSAAKARR